MNLHEKVALTRALVNEGLDRDRTWTILEDVLHASGHFVKDDLETMHLYLQYLPIVDELGLTAEQKYLHLLWDVLEKTPLAVVASFAVSFRRIIAEKLFKKCGRNFIAEENVRFNFGHNIEVGDDVFLNRGVFIDSKGGVKIGDASALGEGVFIFSHTHSESNHQERSYAPVHIDQYVKIYSFTVILPGIHVKKMAIVAAKSLVHMDVEENTVVSGSPAKFVRMRKNEGRMEEKLGHIWLNREDEFSTERILRTNVE